jgi:hypothetical protein
MSDTQVITPEGHLVCEWCGTHFANRSFLGRTPRFCRASHRVRACERRRGLLRPRHAPERRSLPSPGRQGPIGTTDRPWLKLEHERGESPKLVIADGRPFRFHRLRIGGLPDERGSVPSLCGTMVRPTENPAQSVARQNCCYSCERLAKLHPVDPNWWNATTQKVATALLTDLSSTILAVGQAAQGKRDPKLTLNRLDLELRMFAASVGIPSPLLPSMHHRSTA